MHRLKRKKMNVMYKSKLCLGVSASFSTPEKEQIRLIKEAGFDAFFIEWRPDSDLKSIREYADSLGIEIQSVHAPFEKSADMWCEGEPAEIAAGELLSCLKACAEINVPIVVCHAIIGFDKFSPNDTGVDNFRKVVEFAGDNGIKIAFENTEGEMYLEKLMDAFKDYDNVGFCWDSGHEQCYNKSCDMLALYGDRLIATHLNDNLGISKADGSTFWTDDLHLLPFDGIIDWNDAAQRLNKCGYNDILTLELSKTSKPERHENDKYTKMPIEEYIAECYNRACRFAFLKLRLSEK